MAVRVRKMDAARQIHSTEYCRATVSEHGYAVSIAANINYNILTDRQVEHAHKEVRACIDSALKAAAGQRNSNQPIWTTDELIEIQPERKPNDCGDHA